MNLAQDGVMALPGRAITAAGSVHRQVGEELPRCMAREIRRADHRQKVYGIRPVLNKLGKNGFRYRY